MIAGPTDDPSTPTRDEPNFNYDSFYAMSARAGNSTRQLALLQIQGFISNLRIPPGSTIASATLRLYLNDDLTTGYPRTVRIHRMLSSWTTDPENPTTWSNSDNAFGSDGISLDDVEASSFATAEVTLDAGSERFVTADVTADIQAWVNGTPNFGWTLLTDNPDDTASFRTSNHARFNTTATKPATAPPGTPTDPIRPFNKSFAELTDAEWRQVQSPTLTITYTPAASTTDTRLTDEAFFGLGDANSDGIPDNAKLDYASFPGLAAVKSSALSGNYPAARTAFATYLRNRVQPTVPDPALWSASIDPAPPAPGTGREAPTTIAERALNLRFTADATSYAFPNGLPIDWEFSPSGTANFTQYMNRFAYGEDMAKAFTSTGNPVYLTGSPSASPRLFGLAEILKDWITGNPVPSTNINGGGLQSWTTMQAGLRAGHFWPRAWQRVVGSAAFPDDVLVLWAKSYHEHGSYLRSFKASGNSLAMETNGLFMAATLFPEFLASTSWRTEALARLEQQTASTGQIYPEGAQTELTPLYHLTSLRHFAGVIRTALANGITIPTAASIPIEAMFDYVMRLAEPGLVLPDFNDSDQPNTGPIATWMDLGYRLYPSRADFQHFSTSRASGSAPTTDSVYFPYAGQAVMRSGWDAQARYLAFEGGPLGTTHHHDDKLGFVLSAYGSRLVIDPGRFAYDGSSYNNYAFSANAHSVVHIGPFRQSRRFSTGVFRADLPYDVEWRTSATLDYVSADFGSRPGEVFRNGSSSSSPTLPGATHRRHILFDKANHYWLVVDDITQPDSMAREIVQQFHLAAGTTTTAPATQRVTHQIAGGPSLSLTPLLESGSGLSASVVSGQISPEILGWQLTGGSGTKVAIPVARFTRTAAGRVQLATVLAPTASGSPAATPILSRLTTDPSLFGVRVSWSDSRPPADVIVNLNRTNALAWAGQSYATGAIVVSNGGPPFAWGQVVSVEIDSTAATEGQAHRPTLTFSRSGGDNTVPLVVTYALSGSAVAESDYANPPGFITIPANASSAKLYLRLLDDNVAENTKSLTLTVQNGPTFTANSAKASVTLNLLDNDLVSPAAISTTVAPGATANPSILVRRPSTSTGSGTFALTASSPDYTFRKSGQSGGPSYVWNDISSTGTAVTAWYQLNSNFTIGGSVTWPTTSADDRISDVLNFSGGFSFPFFGETSTRLRICSNGFITLGTATTIPDLTAAYVTTNLPGIGGSANYDKAPAAVVAPFWDDLFLDATGSIYTQQLADRYVIQFNRIRTYSNPNIRVTAQVVLYSNGTIEYYYNAVPTSGVAYVVGIQNRSRNKGVQVGTNASNAANVGSLTAVRFTAPVAWLGSGPTSLTLTTGGQDQFGFTLNSAGLTPGTYTTTATVAADDLAGGTLAIPITFTVSAAAAPSGLSANYTASPDSVVLSWQDNASNETGYTLERRTGLSSAWTVVAALPANTTSYTDSAVAALTGYTYRIKANHADGGSGYSDLAMVWTESETTSNTGPTIQVTATDASASEAGSDPGMLVITRSGDTTAPLTVYLSPSGTATPGVDYTALPASITIPAGQSTASLSIIPLDDVLVEADPTESVIVTLSPHASYTLGGPSAMVSIADNDTYANTRPALPSVAVLSPTSARVHWWDNFETNTKYRVRTSTNSDMSFPSGFDAGPNESSFTFTGLAPDVPHYFEVRAERFVNNVNTTSIWSTRLEAIPSSASAWWQQHYGLNTPPSPSFWQLDPDGDGMPNILEYALGTIPTSAASRAALVLATGGGGGVSLTFTPSVVSGLRYIVESSPDLYRWPAASDITASLNAETPYTHTEHATTPVRFLRLKIVAP